MEKFWGYLKSLKKFISLIGLILMKKESDKDSLTLDLDAKVCKDLSIRGESLHNFFDQILYDYALSFVGKPYHWGGDDPNESFDCSGLVIEILKSCSLLPNRYDATSQGIFDYFEKGKSQYMAGSQFGALLFFGESTKKITHVAFALDQYRMIEAGGGGSHVKTLEDAMKYNAFIRIRPIFMRKDLQAKLMPFYNPIGSL